MNVVQRTAVGGSGFSNTVSKAFASNNTSGNKIIAIGFVAGSLTGVSVADSSSNIYTSRLSNYNSSDVLGFEVWTADSIAGGANTVTLTTNDQNANLHIFEVSGLLSSGYFDGHNYNYQTAQTSLTSNSATASSANELLIGASAVVSTVPSYTLGSGYSNLNPATGTVMASATEEDITINGGSYTATFTLNANTTYSVTLIITLASQIDNTSTSTSSSTSTSTSMSSTSTSISTSSTSTSFSTTLSHSTSTSISSTSTSTSISSTSTSTSLSTTASTSTSVSSTSTSTSHSTSTSISTSSTSTSISSTSTSQSSTSSSTSTSHSSTSTSSTSTSISSTSVSTSSTSSSVSTSSTSMSVSTSSTSTSTTTLPIVRTDYGFKPRIDTQYYLS